MNIRYDLMHQRFEAEFSTDFNGDLAAVKDAGFRPDTASGQWVWHTSKIPALNKLREKKPISGLTIDDNALAVYTRLADIEKVNAEARAAFAPIKAEQDAAKRKRKKEEARDKLYTLTVIPNKPGELYDFLGKEDLSPMPVSEKAFIKPTHNGPFCYICGQPVYFYERQVPQPVCLWDEKRLDNWEIL